MGKASRVKYELVEVSDLVNLIQVLKDVADNKFFTLINQKDRFARFGESFVDFFRLISFTAVEHPLLKNDVPTVGILVLTWEGSFLGDLNNKVIRAAQTEKGKYPNSVFIIAGRRGVMKFGKSPDVVKTFENIEATGIYKLSLQIKDYLVEQIMAKRLGKVIAIYPWPKNLNLIKSRVVKLLPAEDLLDKQADFAQLMERIILESEATSIVGYLANLWVSTKIYEMLFDTSIAAAAAQSQQLENSLKKMNKEKAAVKVKYRKAKKGDIDKSLREVFIAKLMLERKAAAKT